MFILMDDQKIYAKTVTTPLTKKKYIDIYSVCNPSDIFNDG